MIGASASRTNPGVTKAQNRRKTLPVGKPIRNLCTLGQPKSSPQPQLQAVQLGYYLESFFQSSRSAFLEAGVHEGRARLHAGLNMHALEHPASSCQVPSPGTRCQQAGVALHCGLQPAGFQIPEHLQSCLVICHLQKQCTRFNAQCVVVIDTGIDALQLVMSATAVRPAMNVSVCFSYTVSTA